MTATNVSVELGQLDATAQAELVRRSEVTAEELVTSAIERIESLNPSINAVVTTAYEQARHAAGCSPSGAFVGVPMLVKDLLIELPGLRFTEGSRFLQGNVSSCESELAARYRRAGLITLGKTNTPEFGMAPACEPTLFGATRNPWDLARSTSGSSGGLAAAVASGMVPIAHGNDLGGSLRYPASACGVFGLKPTRARNPLGPIYGDIMGGLACEHVLTRSVRDSAAILDATAGPSAGDPYPAPVAVGPFLDEVARDPGRLRVAFSRRTVTPTDLVEPAPTSPTRTARFSPRRPAAGALGTPQVGGQTGLDPRHLHPRRPRAVAGHRTPLPPRRPPLRPMDLLGAVRFLDWLADERGRCDRCALARRGRRPT